MFKNFGWFLEAFDVQAGLVRTQEGIDAGHRLGALDDDPSDLRFVEVSQHPVDEVFITVQQNRWCSGVGSQLNGFPLPQQGFEVVNQQLFTHLFGFRTDQQSGAGGLDQNAKGPQPVALVFADDAPRDTHTLALGLEHEKTAGQGQIAGEPWTLGAGGFLHDLHQHFLARFEQFCDAGAAFL